MKLNAVLMLLALAVAQVIYVFCIVMALGAQKRAWKVAPYVVAMIPPIVHASHYGLGLNSLLTGILFLALTKFVVVLTANELGES